jgi:hypothetical protein
MAPGAGRAVAPPIAPMKISHCGEGSFPAYSTTASKSLSSSLEKLCDFQ